MGLKRMKGCVWLSLLAMISLGLMADVAGASLRAKNQPLPVENDLLQFRAGSHIMGFKPDKVYLVNTAGFLSVEFLGAHTVFPKAATVDANQPENEVMLTPGRADMLAGLQRVEYPSLWDGITLRYDAVAEGISESTYFIQPGADVADIRLRYNCDTELLQDGTLKIKLSTRHGYITESKPVAWQVLDGQKKPVQVAYKIQDGTIGFQIGEYSKDHELIIDPTYQWHTFHGSGYDDFGSGIAVDGSGNVYVTGRSYGTWGSPVDVYGGGSVYDSDIVILKLNSSGSLVWHTFHGSRYDDYGKGIAVDGNGNVYVTGCSNATWGTPLNAHGGNYDIVTLKLNSAGTLVWHTFYGSASDDFGDDIAIDGSGNIYLSGTSDATWGSPVHVHGGNSHPDIVALKLSSAGVLMWHTFHGSVYDDYGRNIAIDGSGNVYVTGESYYTWGSPVNAPAGDSDADIVVLKLNSAGVLAWNTFHGSAYDDFGDDIVVDGTGNIYLSGTSEATWGSPVNVHSGNSEIVVMKINSIGALVWHTFHGSITKDDNGLGIAVDGSGNVFITGGSAATWGSPVNAHGGDSDIVVLKLDSSSGTLAWNTFYGSASYDSGDGMAIDGSGNIFVTGSSYATWGTPVHAYNGGGKSDIVVLKYKDDLPEPKPEPTIQTKFLPAIYHLLQRK